MDKIQEILTSKGFYRIYDLQCKRYMATGYNSNSIEDLINCYIDYKSSEWEDETENYYNNLPLYNKISLILSDEFDIQISNLEFEEIY